MNPLLDQLAVAAFITGALAYFGVRFFRKRASEKSCGSDCGCSANTKVPRGR